MTAVSDTSAPPPSAHQGTSPQPGEGGAGAAGDPAGRTGFRGWPRPARWATYVAAVLALVLLAALVAGTMVVRRSFPTTDGEIELPGLSADVTVLRDEHGIPQV
jgi:penicillin amidase